MLSKYIFDSKEFSADVIVLRDLKFIKTFTIEEFKAFFGIKKIEIKKHPKGFLFFPFRDVIGLVVIENIPKNPRISIVIGKFGVPHYILHEFDDIKDFYTIVGMLFLSALGACLIAYIGYLITCRYEKRKQRKDKEKTH